MILNRNFTDTFIILLKRLQILVWIVISERLDSSLIAQNYGYLARSASTHHELSENLE